MTQTADNLAREHDISRNCQDAYAWRSQQRTAHAQAQGWLAEEIAPVQVMQGRENITVKERRTSAPQRSRRSNWPNSSRYWAPTARSLLAMPPA